MMLKMLFEELEFKAKRALGFANRGRRVTELAMLGDANIFSISIEKKINCLERCHCCLAVLI